MTYMKDAAGRRLDGITVADASLRRTSALRAPSYVTTPTKVFDAVRGLYNPTAPTFLQAKAAIANTQMGGASTRGQVLCIGHSHLAGAFGVPGSSDVPANLARILKGRLGGTVADSFAPMRNNQIRDSRYPSSSTLWTPSNSGGGSFVATATTVGAWINYTSDTAGTVVDIVTFENSGSFTYAVDGAATVTVNPTSSNAKIRIISITGLANTIHSAAIASTTTTATYIVGVGVRNTTGLEVVNFGYGGAYASSWTDSTSATSLWSIAHGTVGLPLLTIIQLDVNDVRNAVGVASFKSSLQTVITNAATFGPVMLVLSVNVPGTPATFDAATWAPYCDAVYQLADSNNIALFDMNYYSGGWAEATVAGTGSTDALHLTGPGWYAEALGLAACLAA